MQTRNRPSRAEQRYRRRRERYRRRRLLAVVVLGVLFFAIGTQAAALVNDDPVGQKNVGEGAVAGKESPGVGQASFQTTSEVSKKRGALSAEMTHATAKVKAGTPVATRGQKPKDEGIPLC